MKKILSLLLVTILVAFSLMGAVSATGTMTVSLLNNYDGTGESTFSVEPGATVTLYAVLEGNDGLISFLINQLDLDGFTLTKVAKTNNTKKITYNNLVYEDEEDEEITFEPTMYNAEANGDISLVYDKSTVYEAIGKYNYDFNGTLGKYTLTAPSVAGVYTISFAAGGNVRSNDGSTTSPASINTVNTVITVGTPAPTTYTVTYNANGGTTDATPATVEANGAADLNKTASKDGCTFLGWNTDKDAKTKLDSYKVTGDVTLYAIYEENPVPTGPVLNGVATRLASSVAINNVNHTVNVVYDTAQKVFSSTYVGFAPIVEDGVEVTYSNDAGFRSKKVRLANYTVTTGSAANIDLLDEKTDNTKEAIDGDIYFIESGKGAHNFNMTLSDGVNETVYAVTITLADLATSAEFITEEMANTEGFYKAGRKDDIVNINTVNKVITLTTKNQYNFTTFALNAVTLTGVETAAARQRRTIEVVEADNNIKYTTSSNKNVYDQGVLINYNEGEAKEYTIKIYGGENGISYETYTLKVEYVSARAPENITIHRVQAVENAKVNKAVDINENGAINVTYDAAYDNEGFAIKFVPIINRGLKGEFMNGGKVVSTSAECEVCGAWRPMYAIEDADDIPDAMKYRVNFIRDYRDFAVNFIPKA